MRDNPWLETRLIQLWELLFPEIPKVNAVIIKFKGKWKNKFGHIKQLKNKDSEIVINSLFKDPIVPDYIIDLTIAHELIHYMHGFNSSLPKKFKHPHQGNIVGEELKARGFQHLTKKEKEWVKKTWSSLYPKLIKQLPVD